MARYDRIARIAPPPREDSFHGWLSLRDLEGREREPELGRRARLRYLALRPVRRLLLRGLDGPDSRSLDMQVEALREELDQLPVQDPDRERLDRYLEEIGGRSASGLARATLDVGASAEAAGHMYAAEEFYTTALELARVHEIPELEVAALRRLGRVYRTRLEWDRAIAMLTRSADLARTTGAHAEWARSMEGIAAVHLRQGDPERARAVLSGLVETAPAAEREAVEGVVAAGRCALELAEGHATAALEAGWQGLSVMDPADEERNAVLLNMGAAFRRLGMHDAAASCYRIVVQWAAWPEHRTEARLELVLVAGEAGDADAFGARRRALMETLDRADRPLQALIDLGLGRACLLMGEADEARDHLREAISAARDLGHEEVLTRSEELLEALEKRSMPGAPQAASPDPEAERIGDKVRSLAREAMAAR